MTTQEKKLPPSISENQEEYKSTAGAKVEKIIQQPMKKDTILKTIAFLQRSSLVGAEVNDYKECIDALNKEYLK